MQHCATPGPIRQVHARADVGASDHERIPIDAQAEIGRDATTKLDVVLRERAQLAAAVTTVEGDALVRDVNVRQREKVREVAVAGVVVVEILLWPKRDSVEADFDNMPAGDTRDVGLGTGRPQLAA